MQPRGSQVVVASSLLWKTMPDAVDAVMYIGDHSKASRAHRDLVDEYGELVAGTPLVHFSGNKFTLAHY